MPKRTPQNFVMSRHIDSTGHDVDGLHHRNQDGQPERERHEQEVVHGRQRELQSRKIDKQRINHKEASFDLRLLAQTRADRFDLDQLLRAAGDAKSGA